MATHRQCCIGCMQPRGETALVWRATTGPRRAMRRSCRRTAIIIYHPSSLSPPLSLLLFFLFIPVSFLFSSFAPIPFTTTLPPLPLSHSCSLFFSLSSSPFLSLSSFHSPSTPSPHRLCPFLTPFHVSFVLRGRICRGGDLGSSEVWDLAKGSRKFPCMTLYDQTSVANFGTVSSCMF